MIHVTKENNDHVNHSPGSHSSSVPTMKRGNLPIMKHGNVLPVVPPGHSKNEMIFINNTKVTYGGPFFAGMVR